MKNTGEVTVCGFPPFPSPQFSPGFSPKIFITNVFPQVYSQHLPPFFCPKILSHSSQTFAPKFSSSFPQKIFSIFIIHFYPLLFSLNLFHHSSQNYAPICLPLSLLPNLPPRFFPIVLRLLPSNCPLYFPPKICLQTF